MIIQNSLPASGFLNHPADLRGSDCAFYRVAASEPFCVRSQVYQTSRASRGVELKMRYDSTSYIGGRDASSNRMVSLYSNSFSPAGDSIATRARGLQRETHRCADQQRCEDWQSDQFMI
jgi:hypothetical protein